jgi:hypothetical protein
MLSRLKETNTFLVQTVSFKSNERETMGFTWDEYLHSRFVFRLCAMQLHADVLYIFTWIVPCMSDFNQNSKMGFCAWLFYSIIQFLFSQELNNILNSSLHNAPGTSAEQLSNTRVDDLNPSSLTQARCMMYGNVKLSLYRWMSYFTCTYYF